MGIVFRQSIKTGIVTFTGAALGLLIVYLSTRFIPKQELGFSRVLLNQALIGVQLVLMGLQSMLYVFIYNYREDDERRKVLITISFVIPVILIALFSILYYLLKQQILSSYQPQDIYFLNKYFIWLPLYTMMWAMLTVLEHYLLSQMKVAVSSFTREIILRIANIALILLYGYGKIDFNAFIIYGVLVHIIPILVMFYIAAQTKGFGFSARWRLLSAKEYKSIADFSVFHLLLNISSSLLIYVDSVMLAALDKTGMEAAAVYFVAISIISIYQIPYRAMASAAGPMLNKAYKEGDMEHVKDLYNRSGINTLIVCIGMSVVIICNLHNATALLGNQYKALELLVVILMIGRTVDMTTGLSSEILSISKYYRFNFYLTGLLVILVIMLNLFMIPRFGIYGAAWSSSIALCLYNITKLLFVWYKIDLQPFNKHSFRVLLISAVPLAIGWYLPAFQNPILDAFIRTMVIVVVYSIVIIAIKPSVDIASYIQSIKSNKRFF